MISPETMLPILAGLRELERAAKAGEVFEDDVTKIGAMLEAYTDWSLAYAVRNWIEPIAKQGILDKTKLIEEAAS